MTLPRSSLATRSSRTMVCSPEISATWTSSGLSTRARAMNSMSSLSEMESDIGKWLRRRNRGGARGAGSEQSEPRYDDLPTRNDRGQKRKRNRREIGAWSPAQAFLAAASAGFVAAPGADASYGLSNRATVSLGFAPTPSQ